MSHVAIVPKGSPAPLAPYSPGVKAGNVVHTSGVLALDKEGQCMGVGDVTAQTRAILDQIKAIIESAGGTLADVAFNHVFLKDLKDYAAMNAVYAEYFPANPPARYCIRADLIRPEFLVEVSSMAYLR
jgi:aminoacrylate peracid reductase